MSLIECRECNKEISDKAQSCPHCGAPGEVYRGITRKKWHERTSVTLLIAATAVIVALGFIHLITGVVSPYNLPFDIIVKESFGFRETFIDAKAILTMPYNLARRKHPIGCKVLQKLGYMEPEESIEKRMRVFEKRVMDALIANIEKWQSEFDKALNKPDQQWQDKLLEAAETNPEKITDAQTCNNRAIISATKGQYESAILDFTRALEKNPEYAEAYFNRALVHAAIGHEQQAVSDFTEAIRQKPRFTESYTNRGFIYIASGQYDQAIDDFSKAIETNPDSAELHFKRSLAYYIKAEFSKAWADVHKVLDLGSPVPEEYLKALSEISRMKR